MEFSMNGPIKKWLGMGLTLMAFTLSACTSVFLQPSRDQFSAPEKAYIQYESKYFLGSDQNKIHYWYFPSQQKDAKDGKRELVASKGLVVQFHGNAENMTSHFYNLVWLALEGYDMMTFDYRGYGLSEKEKDIDGTYQDVLSAIDFASQKAKEKNIPLIFYGQSLGGSLLLKALQERKPENLKYVVIESAFYGYKMIAREKLSNFFLTWPFQWLAYLLVTDKYKPGGEGLKKIAPTPILLIYFEDDPVVPVHHGDKIFSELGIPKSIWKINQTGHGSSMFVEGNKYRNLLLKELAQTAF